MFVHSKIAEITENIIKNSVISRDFYKKFIETQKQNALSLKHHCTNLAHGCAVLSSAEKQSYIQPEHHNIGIITAYNDMLSAHHPFKDYPDMIKGYVSQHNMTAQVAGGVPAMCDGVTQGTISMELSLFSRDIIAQSAAVGLSHNLFHGAIYLGVCDKIIPALFIASMRFGHLPTLFLPAGPMGTGLSHEEKNHIRTQYAAGLLDEQDLLASEMKAYHQAGTCTFYGTANSNQVLMEMAGLHLPGSTFLPPYSTQRQQSIQEHLVFLKNMMADKRTLADMICEKTIVNMMIGLLATGGSTNLTIHLIAMARAAGIVISWDDFAALSKIIPTIVSLYPSGKADVNAFHKIGGVPYLVKNLLEYGLLQGDALTITGNSLAQEHLNFCQNHDFPKNDTILRDVQNPFKATGGIMVFDSVLGKGLMKISALKLPYTAFSAPAFVFHDQQDFKQAFQKGQLNQDCVVVLSYQGPRACGMPELHQMMPALEVLQNRGHKVALLTDGRLSGASGKVPALIHITPEAAGQGLIGAIATGDMIFLDWEQGILTIESDFSKPFIQPILQQGMGRELFHLMQKNISPATQGASIFEYVD